MRAGTGQVWLNLGGSVLLIFAALLFSSQQALAQFTQQGPKLVGTGAVGIFAGQGSSAALSADGNTAIVGGPGDNSNIGAVWVYTRSGSVWTQQGSKLVANDLVGPPAYQGQSVALSADGNTAIVGGTGDNNGIGAAWVYTRSGGVYQNAGKFSSQASQHIGGPLLVRHSQRRRDQRRVERIMTASAATLTDPVNGVQNLMTAAPADQAQHIYYEAATALQTVPYAVAGPALGAIAGSNQVLASLWAMYSLFSMVDSDDESAKADYLASVRPILVNPQPGLEFAVSMLANAIEGHLNSPKAVPTLAALLGSGNVAVRRAAAAVLGDIATPDVVVPLAKVALNDSDEYVRLSAVRGLALATSAAKAPTTATFRQQPDEILQFWRTWARSNVRVP